MEQWKFIENSKEYMVSNYGNIKSFKKDKINGQIMKQRFEKDGYKRIMISYPTKRNTYLVHRLVCKAFIENSDNKCCVNHIDNNPSNNHISNLEWCTYSENLIHAEKQGRLKSTHLKAGNSTAKIMKENKIKDINNFILSKKYFNDLKIIKLKSINNIELKNNSRNEYIVECECKCGQTFDTNLTNLTNNIIKRCAVCKSNNTKMKNYNELKNNILNKNYKFIKVLNISDFDNNKEKSDYLILTECNNCKTKREITYKHLIRKTRFISCHKCGHE